MRAGELQLKRATKALIDGRLEDARAACSQALERAPKSAEAFLLLGDIAEAERDLIQAVRLFETAAQLEPHNPRPLIALAGAFVLLDRHQDARSVAARAQTLFTREARSIDALGVVFSQLGDYPNAIQCFEKAVALAPRKGAYLFNLGCAQQFVGAFDEAECAFRRSVEVDPGFEPAYLVLVEMRPQTPTSNLIPALKRLFAAAASDPVRTLTLGHALAKTYEDLGDTDTALQWLNRAKAERRRRSPYYAIRDRDLFDAAKKTAHPAPTGEVGAASDRPIFVVGMPRSGTTLTERILSSHPEASSIGEAVTLPLLVKQMAGDASPRLADARIFERAASIDPGALGRAYLKASQSRAGRSLNQSGRFIDKLPFNFLYAGLIHRALPGARIVCVRRHPLDVCLSNYRMRFGDAASFHDYAHDLEGIARYYVMFDALIEHWKTLFPADRFTELRYETLIADQEGETRRLLAFCGLEWDARCLAFHENDAGVATASARQVRRPLFDTSIGRWRRYGEGMRPAIDILAAAGLLEI